MRSPALTTLTLAGGALAATAAPAPAASPLHPSLPAARPGLAPLVHTAKTPLVTRDVALARAGRARCEGQRSSTATGRPRALGRSPSSSATTATSSASCARPSRPRARRERSTRLPAAGGHRRLRVRRQPVDRHRQRLLRQVPVHPCHLAGRRRLRQPRAGLRGRAGPPRRDADGAGRPGPVARLRPLALRRGRSLRRHGRRPACAPQFPVLRAPRLPQRRHLRTGPGGRPRRPRSTPGSTRRPRAAAARSTGGLVPLAEELRDALRARC